jgi:amino acid adenylation domain-containing protein
MRLDDLLTASAGRTPQAVAARQPDGLTISYEGLESYASAIADRLMNLGVSKGDRVGLCVPKTIGALASVFGVLKAGASYVPVDVGAPATRNSYIFDDCDVAAIIVDAMVSDELTAAFEGSVWAGADFPDPEGFPAGFAILTRASGAERRFAPRPDLAYILYTSGSTGRPKGVMHSHETALAFVDWCTSEFAPLSSDRFSSHAPFHFDLSILDIYVPLKHGASVVLIGSEVGKQPGVLADLIADQRITIWYSTPSILRMLLDYGKLDQRDFSALRIVNFAGEVFPLKHLRSLQAVWSHPTYYNLYGPTETNVCTYYQLPSALPADGDYTLPIGRKCSSDELRIVAPNGQDVRPGEEGELIVAGGSVMLGYWNLPERDAEAFVSHAGCRWYRTGDIVRETTSGDLLFLGRRDRMVKRRGFRVELGEIESALHRHPSIVEAAVVALPKEEGELEVVAFHTWNDERPPSLLKLKQFCAKSLPLYMTPDRFVALPELPKTSTDKINYQRLKELV